MTKTEKQLREQIKDLEKHLEIKQAIIDELKDVINSKNRHYIPYYDSWITFYGTTTIDNTGNSSTNINNLSYLDVMKK